MPTDAEVNAELENLKKQPNVAQALANKVVSEETLKYDIRWQRARFNLATASVKITPEEVEKLELIAAKCPVHRTLEGETRFEQQVELVEPAAG